MEDELKLPMTAKDSLRPLGVFGILKEALRLPTRNGKLMISIILLVLIPSCILTWVSIIVLNPVVRDLVSELAELPNYDPDDPQDRAIVEEIQEDARCFLVLEAVFFTLFCILTLFSLIATVYSSAMTYTGKHFTFKDLLLRMRIRRSWKQPMITSFYVSLVSASYGLLLVGLISFTLMATDGVVRAVFCGFIGLSASLFYVYLTTVWMLGLVISIVEEDCYGLNAIGKAGELMEGRKLQGFALMLLLSMADIAIPVVYICTICLMKQTPATQLVIATVMICLVYLVKLFTCVVNTLFYYECKKNNREHTDEKTGLVYSSVLTGEV